MKLTVANEHLFYYEKNQAIELEGLFSEKQLETLNQAIDQALAERLHLPVDRLHHCPALTLYMAGRDLFRSDLSIRKLICQANLAEVASSFLHQKGLRLAFDQLIVSRPKANSDHLSKLLNKTDPLDNLFAKEQTLETYSHIQGILGGYMVCLRSGKPAGEALISEENTADIFPTETGHAAFFSADCPMNFQKLTHYIHTRYLLISYAHTNSCYRLNENDIHAHALKHYGYGFGDRLNDKLNPMVLR